MKNKKILIYAVIVLAVIGLGVLGYMLAFSNVSKNSTKQNNVVQNVTQDTLPVSNSVTNETVTTEVDKNVIDMKLSDAEKIDYNGYVGRVALHWLMVVSRSEGTLSDKLPTDFEMINIATELSASDDIENYEKNVNYYDGIYKTKIDYAVSRVNKLFGVTIDKSKLGDKVVDDLFTLLPPIGFEYPTIFKTTKLTLEKSTNIYSLYFDEINPDLRDTNYDRFMELTNDDSLVYNQAEVSKKYVLRFKNPNDSIILCSLNESK